ncbi:methyl-accepting chemotaxis protein [Aidingimonas halophila]|uniref:Methyl-accepting chemotaxis protein n=1 Tax=Aidingimonas halophila TaxID=574349 RepID=A0A1H3BEN3_9GAMM|nr:methyl-accepting chemotaxis protein [Aidingimonas halophila]GHC26354.1 chemotaxis transducer [Aidingimonas halophila]SDX40121.1 methyl-accepting chemotaxis protein [Aidingimonas halophila]
MHKLCVVVSATLLLVAVGLTVMRGANEVVYLSLGMAALAGAGLTVGSFWSIYASDSKALAADKRLGWISPQRDYRSLRGMAHRLMQRASSTAIASAEVSFHADRMDQRLERQGRVVKEAVSSMEAISASIEQVSRSAEAVADLASRSRDSNLSSRDALGRVIEEMRALAERSDESLELLEALNTKSDSVRHVTSLIEDIAEQTNLLSLNASIEAARAGEHGRGFAVVAGEVRELAHRTAKATSQVESLVSEIGDSSHRVVDTIGHLMHRVGNRAKAVEDVGAQLEIVSHDFENVEQQVTGIAEAISNTNEHSQQVASTLSILEDEVDEGNRDMHDLASQAHALMEAAEGVDGELAQQRLPGRHQQVYAAARAAADTIGRLFEKALSEGSLSEQQLFSGDYHPIDNTHPQKYRTGYDDFTDRHLPNIQEPLLTSLGATYAITCDQRGYVPTHNQHVSQEPTGDYETDLKYSRSKRLFDDPTGSRCGAHQSPLLVQTYKRDTGEVMHDLSVPVFVAGRHWGGFRIGYHPEAMS